MSVATAENTKNIDDLLYSNPLIQTRTSDPILKIDGVVYENYLSPNLGNDPTPSQGVEWQSQNNISYLYSQEVADSNNGDGIIKSIEINFNGGKHTKLWTGNNGTLTIYPGNESGTKFSFDTNGQGLKLGENGNGLFKIMFGLAGSVAPRDLQSTFNFSNSSGGIAVMGDILIQGGYANNYPSDPITHATLTFNGDLKGKLRVEEEPTANGYLPVVKAIFQGNSNLDGNFNTNIGTTTLLFDHGRITGNVSISLIASPTILRTSGDDMVIGREGGFIGGSLSLTAKRGDANFNNTYLTLGYADGTTGSKAITLNPEDTTKFIIDRGVITFQNMKKLRFVDESNAKKTLTLENGKLDQSIFNFDRELLKANDRTLIVEGNIHAQDGRSLRLSFIDDGVSEALDQSKLKTFTIDGKITVEGGGLSLFYNDRTNSFEGKVEANGGITQTGGYIGRNDAWFESGTYTPDPKKPDDQTYNDILTIQGIQGGISHLKFEDSVDITQGIGSSGGNGVDLSFGGDVTIDPFIDNDKKMDSTSIGKAIYLNNGANQITFNGEFNKINGDIFTSRGDNNITFNDGNSTIVGNINAGGGNNTLVASGETTLQGQLIATSGTNSITIANGQTLTIDSILSDTGGRSNNNITFAQGGSGMNLKIAKGVYAHWGSSTNTINLGTGTLTITDGAIMSKDGTNNITAERLMLTGQTDQTIISGHSTGGNAIYAKGGSNNITITGDNSEINGNVFASGGSNNITFTKKGVTIIGNVSSSGGNNTIAFNGNTTIQGQVVTTASSSNSITFTSGTNSINRLDAGNSGSNTILVSSGNLTITQGMIAQGFGARSSNSITVENGSLMIGGNPSNGNNAIRSHNAGGGTNNTNTINVNGELVVNGHINTADGRNNITLTGTGLVTGNISGSSYFTLGSDTTLTLQGSSSTITTLTAYAPSSTRASGISTLIIDGSLRANTTTISKLANGENLIAKFNGQSSSNSATLKILNSSAGDSNITLRDVTLADNSTNNTLDLTALSNTTITNAISVGETQGLTIALKNTTLTTNEWSNAGTSVISVGGSGVASANSILQGGAVALSGLTLNATNGASMTLQNSSTTIDTLTSSSASGDTLKLDASDNNVNATIDTISGNLTAILNGTSATQGATLTLNGVDNTLQALKLGDSAGTAQSTHNILAINKGKTSITDKVNVGEGDNTQGLLFTLKDSTELVLTAGLTTGNNGTSTLSVVEGANATLSGAGAINFTNLDMVSSSSSSLTFKNTGKTTIDTLTSNATATQINTLIMGEGASGEVIVNSTANGTKFNLTFDDNSTNSAKTFTLAGGENTIKQVLVDSNDTGTNTLKVKGGSTTIDTISASGKNFTLALSSDNAVASNTLVTINTEVNGGNVTFSEGINPADQIHFSTLLLKGASNTISSVTTDATNAKIVVKDTATAEITNLTIQANKSILLGFEGNGNSKISLGSGIAVGNNQTLGISIGGSGTRELKVEASSGSITFNSGSTLVVDFQETKTGDDITATLGNDSGFTITGGSNSIINLRGGSGRSQLKGGVTLDGGNNTVNFIGNATLSNINLKSGTNTINVYEGITGIVDVATTDQDNNVGNVTNIINLTNDSTLKLINGGTENASLVSSESAKPSTLNFKGNNATLQGGFEASGTGTATINVGENNKSVNGIITGNISNATVVFKGDVADGKFSKLTLQGETNTISSLSTESTNGILVLDASKGAVNASVTSGMSIDAGKSITIALHSTKTSNQDATFDVAGNITVNGTLGIAISGDGNGNRTISTSSGGQINFADHSTLRVDFLENSAGSATLGGENKFEIGANKNSEINFYAGSTATLAGEGLVLKGGTNTVNFYGNATLGQISLESGTNNINVKDRVTAKIENTNSTLGSVTNTINLGANSILQLEATTGNNGDGSIITTDLTSADGQKVTLTNILNFNGKNATLKGGFGVADGASSTATINVKNLGAVITGNVSNAGVSFDTTDESTLTLQGENNTLKTLNSSVAGSQIILDASKNAVNTTITTAISGSGNVGLKFGNGDKAKTFTFSDTNNSLSGVEFDERGSTNNKIAFTNGSNTITNPFSITQGQGLTIALGDGNTNSTDSTQISLALTGGFSQEGGSATLRVEGANTADALISGGDIEVGNLDMVATTSASLTLKNSSVSIGTLTAQNGSNTLKLDASSNAVETTINSNLAGDKLAITLAGSSADNSATLTLNGTNNTIKTLSLDASSANNKVALGTNKALTIKEAVSVGSSQGIAFELNGSSTTFERGLTNSQGAINLNINGASTTINGAISTSGGTTTFSLIDGTSLTLSNGASTSGGATNISFAGNSSITGNISTSGSGANTAITLAEEAVSNIKGNISNANSATTSITLANNANLTLKNGTQAISTMTLANNISSTLNLQQATTTIGSDLTLSDSKTLNVNIDGTSSLTLASVSTTSGALNINGSGSLVATGISSSTTSANNTINVGTLTLNGNLGVESGSINNITANTLTITGDITGNSTGANTNANNITANNITLSSANITAGTNDDGWGIKNRFDISGKTTFSNASLVIKSDSTANAGGAKHNIFRFGGNVETFSIAEISAVTENNNLTNTANILSFDGLTSATSFGIADINKSSTIADKSSGYNYIGKDLTSGSGDSLALKGDFESNWSSEEYQAKNLELNVSGTINVKSGKNYINVGTLNANTLNADGGINNIALGGARSQITGDITSSNNGQNNFVLSSSNATLTLVGKDSGDTSHTIATFNASGENTALVLDNSSVTDGAMRTTISTLNNGANLTATLKGGGSSKEATLALNGGTLKSLTLGEGSTGNILDLSNATSLTIANQVSVGNNQDLTIKLKNTALTLNNGIVTNGNGSKIELVGDTTATSTLSGGAIHISDIALSATESNALTLSKTSAVIDKLGASGNISNALILNEVEATISSILDSAQPLTLTLNHSSLNMNGALSGGSGALDIELRDSTLSLSNTSNEISSLSANGDTTIDLARVDSNGTPIDKVRSASPRKTLSIGNFSSGSANFILYANPTTADNIIINEAGENTQATISVVGGKDIYNISYTEGGNNNVMVAEIGSNAKDKVKIVGGESMIGAEVVDLSLQAVDGVDNGGVEYYIGKVVDRGIAKAYQEIASSALTVNYDLFLANFNSLNKRMGELRDNPYNQGVWARVFGGAMSNDFGAGSKTDYVTAQAGYDYSLSLGNARNYMGVAVAYGKSWTKGNDVSTANIVNGVGEFSLSNVNSNMVEVGIYNSYVSESGWYNDTIFKFDYIMSEFSLSNDPNTMSNTSNFAMVLSDEFGYRYSFGVSEKGSWYIDPQAEFAFGYFNQSDFNRAVYDASMNATDLNAKQDTILTLRSRAGLSLGKKFNTERGFASLYVGAFYEYDYIEGGNAQATGRVGGTITQLDKVESNGRAIVNLGSNIELMDGVRMYIDVEKSFGDKQRTDMQFNFGARYSFGERSAILSKQTQQRKEITPLKVSEENASVQEDSQTKSQEQQENSTDKMQEEKKGE